MQLQQAASASANPLGQGAGAEARARLVGKATDAGDMTRPPSSRRPSKRTNLSCCSSTQHGSVAQTSSCAAELVVAPRARRRGHERQVHDLPRARAGSRSQISGHAAAAPCFPSVPYGAPTDAAGCSSAASAAVVGGAPSKSYERKKVGGEGERVAFRSTRRGFFPRVKGRGFVPVRNERDWGGEYSGVESRPGLTEQATKDIRDLTLADLIPEDPRGFSPDPGRDGRNRTRPKKGENL